LSPKKIAQSNEAKELLQKLQVDARNVPFSISWAGITIVHLSTKWRQLTALSAINFVNVTTL